VGAGSLGTSSAGLSKKLGAGALANEPTNGELRMVTCSSIARPLGDNAAPKAIWNDGRKISRERDKKGLTKTSE